MATKFPWPEKDPEGVDPYGFDAALRLETGETLADCVWTIEVDGDEAADPDAADMLGAEVIDGTEVLVVVADGVDGVDYTVKAVITTSTARVIVAYASLPVRAPRS